MCCGHSNITSGAEDKNCFFAHNPSLSDCAEENVSFIFDDLNFEYFANFVSERLKISLFKRHLLQDKIDLRIL